MASNCNPKRLKRCAETKETTYIGLNRLALSLHGTSAVVDGMFQLHQGVDTLVQPLTNIIVLYNNPKSETRNVIENQFGPQTSASRSRSNATHARNPTFPRTGTYHLVMEIHVSEIRLNNPHALKRDSPKPFVSAIAVSVLSGDPNSILWRDLHLK
jgi:hypothetical protein